MGMTESARFEQKDHKRHIAQIKKQKEMLKRHRLQTTEANRKNLKHGYRSLNDNHKLFDSI